MSKPTEAELVAENAQLMELSEQLQARIEELSAQKEQLTSLVESLRAQLSLAEARAVQLTSLVAESAEDLRPYDGSFHKPSSITSITYNPPTAEIEINGTRVLPRSSIRESVWEMMLAYANQVNALSAQKRRQAGIPEPAPEDTPPEVEP